MHGKDKHKTEQNGYLTNFLQYLLSFSNYRDRSLPLTKSPSSTKHQETKFIAADETQRNQRFLFCESAEMFGALVHSQSVLGPGEKSSFVIFIFVVSQAVPGPVMISVQNALQFCAILINFQTWRSFHRHRKSG